MSDIGKTVGIGASILGVLAAIGRALAWVVGWGMKPYDTKLETCEKRLDDVELACVQSAKKEDIARVEKTIEQTSAKTAFDIAKIGEDVGRIFQSIETSRSQMFDRFETEGQRLSGMNVRIAKLESKSEE